MANYPFYLSQGKFVREALLTFPAGERASQFGDGVYEVIRVYGGKPYLQAEHLERLYRSLAAIKISINESFEEMNELISGLLEKNNVTADASIYLQISRGTATRNHLFPQDTPANIYAYVYDQARNLLALENGVHAITLPDERWANCYIKSLNLLPNVLAKQTAAEQGATEAILYKDGVVTEGSSSNIYLVRDGQIFTHPVTKGILHGCVRMAIQRFAAMLGIPFIEEAFTPADIVSADELFLTSSSAEIQAIIQVDDLAIGNGLPGLITKKLLAAYEADAGISH